jgi:hypothetical protein
VAATAAAPLCTDPAAVAVAVTGSVSRRRAFFAQMLEPADYWAEASDLFGVKLGNFGHLRPDQRLGILRHYRGHLDAVLSHLAAARAYVAEQPQIPEVERPWVLRVIDHRTHVTAAEKGWVDAEVRRTESQPEA